MSGLIEQIIGQLGPDQVGAIAQQLGTDPQTTQAAIDQALPLIVGGLAHRAGTPEGAGALHDALQDHAGAEVGDVLGRVLGGGTAGAGGGLGGLLGGLFGGGQQGGLGSVLGNLLGKGGAQQGGFDAGPGGAILGHIFGSKIDTANQGLGQTTGLGAQGAGQLLAILAPIVMSVLANHSRSQGLSPGGLGEVLAQQTQSSRQQGGLAGGLLGAVLDHNGDGKIDLSEMIQAAGGLLGGRRTV